MRAIHFRLFNHTLAEVSHVWTPMPYSGWVSESVRLAATLSTTQMVFEWCSPTGWFSEILMGTLRVFPSPAVPLVVSPILDALPPTAWDRIMGEDPF